MTMAADTRPSPGELWAQAGGDGTRYRALLREHGHLVPLKSGETAEPLPCGWPGPAQVADRRLHEAQACYVEGMRAAGGDPDLIAAVERTFIAELGAIEAYVDAAEVS